MTDRENHMPRYFAVWSATGVHVGIWEDGKIAADVLAEEYPGGTMRELVDASALRPEAQGVKIKPLEWRTFCSTSGNCEAKTTVGKYVIQREGDDWDIWTPLDDEDDPSFTRETLEAAKSRAQADYEARILSALDRPEAQDGVAEAREVSEEEAKQRLLAGDRIVFSMDGDEAWFADGDRASCNDVVIGLRQKGYLTRKTDPECDRGFCWDEASDRLRALSQGGK